MKAPRARDQIVTDFTFEAPPREKRNWRTYKLPIEKDKKFVTRRSRREIAREALVARLKAKGKQADVGRTVDTNGMSDEEFIALLRR